MSLSTAHTTLLDELDALAPQLLLVLGGTGLGKTTVLRSLIRRRRRSR
jgi:ABC-type transporter Mla maintaining outer membrane lipid asymmetry ATPase subunit MlaF